MKRIFLRSKLHLLAVPAALMVALCIGCGSSSEPAPAEEPAEIAPATSDSMTPAVTDSIPVDSGAGTKPPVPIKPEAPAK